MKKEELIFKLTLSELGPDAHNAVITAWHAGVNARVTKGQDLLEIATDKATFDVPAPCDGVISKIFRMPGETALTDEVIAEIREDRPRS